MIYDNWYELKNYPTHTKSLRTFTDFKYEYLFVDKILDTEGKHMKKLLNEFFILSSLNLENIIKIKDINEYDTYVYLTMERLPCNLELDYKTFTKKQCNYYLEYIKDIIKTIYSLGIVHNNLRLENFKIRNKKLILSNFLFADRVPQNNFEESIDMCKKSKLKCCEEVDSFNYMDIQKKLNRVDI